MIFAIIVIVFGIAGMYYLDSRHRKLRDVKYDDFFDEEANLQTAQEFVNVREIQNDLLYTIDGNAFAYVKIDGISLELFSDREIEILGNSCAQSLSKYEFPYKFLAVSRRVDFAKTIQILQEQYHSADGGRRKLLWEEMEELAELEMSGTTLERQYYFMVWGNLKDETEAHIKAKTADLTRVFADNKFTAKIANNLEIETLCWLVNIPNYAHIETKNTEGSITALLQKYQKEQSYGGIN